MRFGFGAPVVEKAWHAQQQIGNQGSSLAFSSKSGLIHKHIVKHIVASPLVGKVWCCEIHWAIGGSRQIELLPAPEIGAKPTGDAGGYAEYGENLVLGLGFRLYFLARSRNWCQTNRRRRWVRRVRRESYSRLRV
jgi:hypothetical protein